MSGFDWLPEFVERLAAQGVRLENSRFPDLEPARTVAVARESWGRAAATGHAFELRFAGLWGDPVDGGIVVRACLVRGGERLVLVTETPGDVPAAECGDDFALPSMASWYPGASRLERHLADMLGVRMSGQDDGRRWTRHRAWREGEFPLRCDFPVQGLPPRRTPSDDDYAFRAIQGSGVCEIPVGPVHAGIIEPGHFRFQVVGEEVLALEERLGYVHKGIEKIAVGRDAEGLARLAGRVSGDSTVAHAWAACQAMERAAGCSVSRRASYLRGLACERERVANHLGDIGAICNDVGFGFAHAHLSRLRESWQRASAAAFGHRLLMDVVVPGGVAGDVSTDAAVELRRQHDALRREIEPLFAVIDEHPSLEDRLVGTGVLSPADAASLGCTGYVGKASGQAWDLRVDAPSAPWDEIRIEGRAASDQGDVAARVRVRMDEIRASLDAMDRLLDGLPVGGTRAEFHPPAGGGAGLAMVDGWRGEIMTFVRFGADGRIARYFPRDPSWFTWPALERLIGGNIVPDFPVCNKSVNASYSGHDL